MQISLTRNSITPLYVQLAQELQRRIGSGALPAGSRLPTIRALAQQLGVTRLTIHAAYNELQAGGWIEATVGRGTFVAERQYMPVSTDSLRREVSAGGLISDMLRMAQLPGMRSLAMADAAPELYPQRDFSRAMQEALSSGVDALGYAAPHGDPTLRTVLAELLVGRGMRVAPDELLITAGVTQGLALVARTLAQPGDTILVEHPTYLGALSIFGAHGLRSIGVPLDQDGMVVEDLEAMIVQHQPRFIYLIPVFQNPTGSCMSSMRRRQILDLAVRHRIPIVEDDIYAQLSYAGVSPSALYAEDSHTNVIYLSSFSKVLLPGVRIGYIAAGAPWIDALIRAKQTSDLCSPPMLQRAMAVFVQRGWLASHLRRVLPQYRERRDCMLTAMGRYLPSGLEWSEPDGGFCVWVRLPDSISATELYLAAIERSVAFVPGDVFFSGPAPYPAMRLSFSAASRETIVEVVRVIGELLSTHDLRRAGLRNCRPLV